MNNSCFRFESLQCLKEKIQRVKNKKVAMRLKEIWGEECLVEQEKSHHIWEKKKQLTNEQTINTNREQKRKRRFIQGGNINRSRNRYTSRRTNDNNNKIFSGTRQNQHQIERLRNQKIIRPPKRKPTYAEVTKRGIIPKRIQVTRNNYVTSGKRRQNL